MSQEVLYVSTYFNPCGWRSRRENHDEHRRALDRAKVPHLTVELVFDPDGASELGESTDVVTIRGGSVMWQKEQLAVIGFDRGLRAGWKKLALLDGDVFFEGEDWAAKIASALDEHDAVQAFEVVVRHYSDVQARFGAFTNPACPERFRHPGTAWGFRSDFVETAGLYRHAIVGGGDRLMAQAWHDLWARDEDTWPIVVLGWEGRSLSPAMRWHFLEWARRGRDRGYRFAWVPGVTVRCAPHGTLATRAYAERREILEEYDPAGDVAVGPSGAFVFSSEKPRMHAAIRRYFENRREDG